MDFALDEKTVEMRERLLAFMEKFVYPAEGTFREQADSALLEQVGYGLRLSRNSKAEARAQGLWRPVPARDALSTARG